MSDNSKIEWTDATWNPVTGCSVVSPGCTNCYAMDLAGTRLRHHHSRAGLTKDTKAGPVWTGEVRFNEEWLTQPLQWKRPRRIFVCAHGDLFHEAVPDEWIDRVFDVIEESRQHVFQILTKRPKRMREYMTSAYRLPDRISEFYRESGHPITPCWQPPKNVWLGVSAEDQKRADERVPELLATPAAVRFVSAEPLLGPIDFTGFCNGWYFVDALRGLKYHDAPEDMPSTREPCARLDWVIVGGESGPDVRPMHPDWVRSVRDQCAAAGVPFFFKQWGEWLPDRMLEHISKRGCIMRPSGEIARASDETVDAVMRGTFDFTGYQHFSRVGKRRAGRILDGRTHDEFPEARHDNVL